MAGVGEPRRSPRKSNRDWLDCDRRFAQQADGVILQVLRRSPDAVERATQLMCRYKKSPLAYAILAEAWLASGNLVMAKTHLRSATVLAPRCPYISLALAAVLVRMGSWEEAVRECARGLGAWMPTDPARHSPLPEDSINAIVSSPKVSSKGLPSNEKESACCVSGPRRARESWLQLRRWRPSGRRRAPTSTMLAIAGAA
ncbi:Os11g0549607 [Oryza sativa Japonica Group]|jgi:hypothetical protein|uniref:Os11g0549607 protein n=1 Tax=Oryza sativa subsp. japonica TaxID=39947 RepID=A0A0P0Y370_ORYSJ|nr:Os11g0549607 [Oryza sativa Japonica Group]